MFKGDFEGDKKRTWMETPKGTSEGTGLGRRLVVKLRSRSSFSLVFSSSVTVYTSNQILKRLTMKYRTTFQSPCTFVLRADNMINDC